MPEKEIVIEEQTSNFDNDYTKDVTLEIIEEETTHIETTKNDYTKDYTLEEIKSVNFNNHHHDKHDDKHHHDKHDDKHHHDKHNYSKTNFVEVLSDQKLDGSLPVVICNGNKDIVITMPNINVYNYEYIEFKNVSRNSSVKLVSNNTFFSSTVNRNQYMINIGGYVRFMKFNGCWLHMNN